MKPVEAASSSQALTAVRHPKRLQKKYPASQRSAADQDALQTHNAQLHDALMRAFTAVPPNPGWRGAFYASLRANVTDLDTWAAKRYGARDGARCLQKLRALRPNCEDLVVDPGLVQRLDAFCAFVALHTCTDAVDARQRFSARCGLRTVLRGLALLPDEARAVARTGMLCRGGAQLAWGTHGPLEDVWRAHVLAGTKASPFLSATLSDDVARSIAFRSRAYEEQKVYLFTLRIPELDSISAPAGSARYRNVGFSEDIELLIGLGVHGSEIVGLSQGLAEADDRPQAKAKGRWNVGEWFKRS